MSPESAVIRQAKATMHLTPLPVLKDRRKIEHEYLSALAEACPPDRFAKCIRQLVHIALAETSSERDKIAALKVIMDKLIPGDWIKRFSWDSSGGERPEARPVSQEDLARMSAILHFLTLKKQEHDAAHG